MKTLLTLLLFSTALAQDPVASSKTFGTPKLTADQKLEITRAQVAVYQAKEVLESTPQFKAFQNAQNNLNETALRVQRESKVDPTKYTLGQDLEFSPVPQPQQGTGVITHEPVEKKK